MFGRHKIYIASQLFVDISQGRRYWYIRPNGEAEAVRLTGAVIGVLPEYNNLHGIKWRCIKCGEDFIYSRIDRLTERLLFTQKFMQLEHSLGIEVGLQPFPPGSLEFYLTEF